MTKHAEETHTLAEIINGTDDRADGWPVLDALGIEWDDLTDADRKRPVIVSWPDHVINPSFNGDATYAFAD